MDEFDIMFSSDKTVRLTNKRIVVENGERQQEILLEDYLGYSIEKKNIGNYGSITNLLGLLTLLLLIGTWHDSSSLFNHFTKLSLVTVFFTSNYAVPFCVCGLLFLISLFYYVLGRRYLLELKGKYNSISVSIKKVNNKSLKRFLATIIHQRDKIKPA